MSSIGIVARRPPISLDEWLRHVEGNTSLVPKRPREIVNPFKGTRELFRFEPGVVDIVVDGVEVGSLEPSAEFDDDHEIDIYAVPAHRHQVEQVVTRVAATLAADVTWFEDQ